MLQIKNLSKSYGAKKAVSNLSFVVEDGDIMGFIGKNGAGKTTTLKACLGIIGIDEGEILPLSLVVLILAPMYFVETIFALILFQWIASIKLFFGKVHITGLLPL